MRATASKSARLVGSVLVGAAAALAAACDVALGPPPTLIVGVTRDGVETVPFEQVRIRTTVRGSPSSLQERVVTVADLPIEITRTGADSALDSPPLDVEVAGIGSRGPDDVRWTRRAWSSFDSKATRLVRVGFDPLCFERDLSRPRCDAPATCQRGLCGDAQVTDAPIYDPAWKNVDQTVDGCRPQNAGAPRITVGSGASEYNELADDQVLPVERGPQGGHHVWVAIRTLNLARSGAFVSLRGRLIDDGAALPSTTFVFSLDNDEGGYCKLFGLRYQLDNGTLDYRTLLGKKLAIDATVTDRFGNTASDSARIVIASTVIGE